MCSENCWKTCNLDLRTVEWVKRIFQSFLWKGMNRRSVPFLCNFHWGNEELNSPVCFLEHPIEFTF